MSARGAVPRSGFTRRCERRANAWWGSVAGEGSTGHVYPQRMLCTVISDSYTTDERAEVGDALSTLLTLDSPDWSRKGVYAYWDRETHELLYLGLASDLPLRFAQHNGLASHSGGNKKKEIDEHFLHRTHLGFTIVIQGAAVAIHDAIVGLDFTLGVRSDELIAVGEGQLIETHRLVHGHRPPWNNKGGAKEGTRWAMAAPALLNVLAARRSSLFVARRSLRDLARDDAAKSYEAAIHAARMRATMVAHEVGHFPAEQDDLVRAIGRSIMLSAGHLLDEFDASDDEIIEWLRKLGDPAYWQEEARERLRMLEEVRGHPLQTNERMITDILNALFEQAAPPEHIRATEDVFATGYLYDEPQLHAETAQRDARRLCPASSGPRGRLKRTRLGLFERRRIVSVDTLDGGICLRKRS
jgi:hypothetical protein